jgi:hypothetical protein
MSCKREGNFGENREEVSQQHGDIPTVAADFSLSANAASYFKPFTAGAEPGVGEADVLHTCDAGKKRIAYLNRGDPASKGKFRYYFGN